MMVFFWSSLMPDCCWLLPLPPLAASPAVDVVVPELVNVETRPSAELVTTIVDVQVEVVGVPEVGVLSGLLSVGGGVVCGGVVDDVVGGGLLLLPPLLLLLVLDVDGGGGGGVVVVRVLEVLGEFGGVVGVVVWLVVVWVAGGADVDPELLDCLLTSC